MNRNETLRKLARTTDPRIRLLLKARLAGDGAHQVPAITRGLYKITLDYIENGPPIGHINEKYIKDKLCG